jgi:hypothetical protein
VSSNIVGKILDEYVLMVFIAGKISYTVISLEDFPACHEKNGTRWLTYKKKS